jgi:hypothetical protein
MGGLNKKYYLKTVAEQNHHRSTFGGGGKSFLYNLICMGASQQTGLMRADLTGLAYAYAQPSYKKKKP